MSEGACGAIVDGGGHASRRGRGRGGELTLDVEYPVVALGGTLALRAQVVSAPPLVEWLVDGHQPCQGVTTTWARPTVTP